MASSAARAFVVGVDGSDSALDAVAWAAREAFQCQATLRIVHAYVWPLLHMPPRTLRMGPSGGLHAHTERLLDEARQTAREAAPGVDVHVSTVTQFPLPALVEASKNASYVVVGSSGRGPVSGALVGSVAVGLVAHAHSPVAVVRGGAPPDRFSSQVVVGVDGTQSSCAAMRLAVDVAARRHGQILAVHVVRDGPARARSTDPASGVGFIEDALVGWRRRYPELPIEERILSGRPSGVLADLSEQAAVVAVGARGRGGFAGLLRGSVSQALMRHARCPVLVVSERTATAVPMPHAG